MLAPNDSRGCAASFTRLFGSAAPRVTLPRPFELARWALRGTVRAEDTAITSLGLENLMTCRALVDVDARIGGHRLEVPMAARRTSDSRVEDHEPRRCSPSLQALSEAADAPDLDESKRTMRRRADEVVRLCIRRELGTPLVPPPLLRCRDERATHAPPPGLWHDEPPLEVGDAVTGAPLGTQTNRELREAKHTPSSVFGQEHAERFTGLTGEKAIDLCTVFGFGAIGPESVAQTQPGTRVAPGSWSNRNCHEALLPSRSRVSCGAQDCSSQMEFYVEDTAPPASRAC
jgi:hypothetical protein